MVTIAKETVTGLSLSRGKFKIEETAARPNKNFRDIAGGRALGQLVKGYLSHAQCNTIAQNFETNPGLRVRANGVAGQTVGVDQYRARPDDYLTETLRNRESVDRLFVGSVHVPTQLRSDIQLVMKAGVAVRPAMADGIRFNDVRAVRWMDSGTHALKPHDDFAQLTDPIQAMFETAHVAWPVAFNVYPAIAEGGELEVYNIAPDDATRERLGISLTGYPYPTEALDRFDRLVIKPEPGDLLILSGRFVHGVRGVGGSRIILNHFGGYIDNQTFVTWS